ncbi:hypothetical protein H310_14082 [Aphanomyces invadans]|uniref:dolichyl-diphosphooligosaccharide--protein glycotransferase n=1 Tax=Aphanomyces invadans TaxID=157072 RepID=A0A024TAN1_9STRA|nr:hypothetical protein H310_14082 [Aphanomyces invadans]ETV91205.1 hypothetical protein H310_14082 [Aphanomyces invadans]RHY24207.1 hypothetical protein DYB32_008943 [Aphanomyces invadans]|eukprot:XP_008880042.1 hypothetical protein H310_14082 [Aphanomyces invadans]
MGVLRAVGWTIGVIATVASLVVIGYMAAEQRMDAIRKYGMVIHEFDPWFNFRAAVYLADNGYERFFKWYDYMSWYPLGRPVGTTIYPGMQIVSVTAWELLNKAGISISLNDVCCLTPVWGGVFATLTLSALTYVCTGRVTAALVSGWVMSIIPAHLMRSVGGGYDNESVAVSCLLLTFLFWCVSLKSSDDSKATYVGVLTGLAYIAMAATWGGYIYVLNMIGLHAFVLVLLGRYSNKLYWAYSIWYIIGTIGAMQVPVIGKAPLRSLEQLAPLLVFFGLQGLKICHHPVFLKKVFNIDAAKATRANMFLVYSVVAGVGLAILAVVVQMLWPTGYFGPLSSRIRGLFVQHTRTGNPLVDSVAEHQPVKNDAFWQFLHATCYTAPVGLAIVVGQSVLKPWISGKDARSDPLTFVVVYSAVTYFFSTKMNRLMLLMAGPASIATGVVGGYALDFVFAETADLVQAIVGDDGTPVDVAAEAKKDDDKKAKKKAKAKEAAVDSPSTMSKSYNSGTVKLLRKVAATVLVAVSYQYVVQFYQYTQMMKAPLSGPSITFEAQLRSGEKIIVDDYREGYHWLRDNTPQDARVMAWWDYGYQITGIGNRTTIADGNTWNHEHIALLARCLTSPEKRAHNLIKHLADYVLIWAGGGGDDLAKSPHLARIGNSVFEDICPGDPVCSNFGFYSQNNPTPMMKKSLLYRLHQHGINPQVNVDPNRFRMVFQSKYGLLRIFKVVGVSDESKKWIEDPANRLCDAPGSWYCTGQYPPALADTLAKRKSFKQIEDFNIAQDEKSKKYHEEYLNRMEGKAASAKSGAVPVSDDDEDEASPLPPTKMVGCYGTENSFEQKTYVGGQSGAYYGHALHHAVEAKAKYFAIARGDHDGHSFVFHKLKSTGKWKHSKDCERPCLDDGSKACGCMDGACTEPKMDGEEHNRRWIVYEVLKM